MPKIQFYSRTKNFLLFKKCHFYLKSAARLRSFNQQKVFKFFDLLEGEMLKQHFSKDRIYNVDETGICVMPSKKVEIVYNKTTVHNKTTVCNKISLKGKKSIRSLTSAERGALITEICPMNPVGTFIPPTFIFLRKKVPKSFMDGAPFNS